MYKVVYWGGPKDGTEEQVSSVPEPEQYCMSPETPMMTSVEFETTIKENIHRSVAYSKYICRNINKNTYKYEFAGFQ